MFQEKSTEAVGFDSTWKTDKEVFNQGTQTADLTVKEQHTNTTSGVDASTNMDNANTTDSSSNIDFGVYDDIDDSNTTEVLMLQNINVFSEKETGREVSALSWNSTGHTLAVACMETHESWCHHEGEINIYTFNRDEKLNETPRKLMNGACITSLSFHPLIPAVLAAGTYTGDLLVWNTQNEENNTPTIISGHEDCINNIEWVSDTDNKLSPLLASAGRDTKLILWQFNTQTMKATKKNHYKISAPSVPTDKDILKYTDQGITCFDFSPHTYGLFVVGAEGGTVIRCSILGAKPLDSDCLNPVVSYYDPHEGSVTSLSFASHRKDLFITLGTDLEISIYQVEQKRPVQKIFLQTLVHQTSWISLEPRLLISCTNDGGLLLHNLFNGQTIKDIKPFGDQPLVRLAVNQKKKNMAVVGDKMGSIQLWSIPWNNIAMSAAQEIFAESLK